MHGTFAGNWIAVVTQKLTAAGIGSARLDGLILLEDEIGKDRAWVLAHPEFELSEMQIRKLNKKVARRSEHLPLAYIRGHVEFYGREFAVNEHVLVPRPESETIIDLLKSLAVSEPVIVDVGAGSGALAVSAKLELPTSRVTGTDIDSHCLAVARRNAKLLGASVEFVESDLVDSITQKPDVILANLPYVPDGYEINQAAGHEPGLALFGGPDGLDLFRRMFGDCDKKRLLPAYVITEALPEQHEQLATITKGFGYKQVSEDGFAQLFKQD